MSQSTTTETQRKTLSHPDEKLGRAGQTTFAESRFWLLPRALTSFLQNRLFGYHTVPPLTDETEFLLVALAFACGCYYIKYIRISAIALLVIHICRGVRWQLYVLYTSLLLVAFDLHQYLGVRIWLLISTLIVLALCLVCPMAAINVAYSESKWKHVGVQDVAVKLADNEPVYMARVYYPCSKTYVQSCSARKPLELLMPRKSVLFLALAVALGYGLSQGEVLQTIWANLACFVVFHISQVALEWSNVDTTLHMPEGSIITTGMAEYMELPRFLISAMGLNRMQAYEDAPVISAEHGEIAEGTKLRIALMVPGLGGLRNTYAQQCYSLASEGFFVISLESADGTASITQCPDGTLRKYVSFKPEDGEDAYGPRSHAFRHGQLNKRVGELDGLMRIFTQLSQGKSGVEKTLDLQIAFTTATSNPWASRCRFALWPFQRKYGFTRDLTKSLFLQSLKSVQFADKPFLVGHSFGGATVTHMATDPGAPAAKFRSTWGIAGVVSEDMWCFALSKQTLNLDPLSVTPPFFIVHADLFAFAENTEVMVTLSEVHHSTYIHICIWVFIHRCNERVD
jgi:hypothetical protein